MATRVVFTGKQAVKLEEFSSPEVMAGQIKLRGLCSLISTGTENIVFNQLYAPGTHWDNWVKYPFYPGYSFIGEVVEVGACATDVKIGDRAATRGGHASEHVVDLAECHFIPTDVDPKDAAWFALAKISYAGAQAANYSLGSSALIVGAGPIGQMSLRWATAAGCSSVVVLDPVESRLKKALTGGATSVIAAKSSECLDKVLAANNGGRPSVVIDGTGNTSVFEDALRLVADHGTVVILGDTGFPTEQHLSSDVITRSLKIVGAHDGLNIEQWDNRPLNHLFFTLNKTGRFNMDGLNTHTFKPSQAVDAYELLNAHRGDTMGVIFDWS
jgi:2-desacetyl-2-hydroxyethyl bacteriochlorophyllide A dehydrogenase